MLIGDDFDPVERRITKALCSGRLPLQEAKFLQDISRKIGLYRERAILSDAQASWLSCNASSRRQGRASISPMYRGSWGTLP